MYFASTFLKPYHVCLSLPRYLVFSLSLQDIQWIWKIVVVWAGWSEHPGYKKKNSVYSQSSFCILEYWLSFYPWIASWFILLLYLFFQDNVAHAVFLEVLKTVCIGEAFRSSVFVVLCFSVSLLYNCYSLVLGIQFIIM